MTYKKLEIAETQNPHNATIWAYEEEGFIPVVKCNSPHLPRAYIDNIRATYPNYIVQINADPNEPREDLSQPEHYNLKGRVQRFQASSNPLTQAESENDYEALRYLLSNQKTKSDFTSAYRNSILQKRYNNTFLFDLPNGNIFHCESDGKTLFSVLSNEGDINGLRLFVDDHALADEHHDELQEGYLANIHKGNYLAVKELTEKGASPTTINIETGETPLNTALENARFDSPDLPQRMKIVAHLLSNRAPLFREESKLNSSVRKHNIVFYYPLYVSAMHSPERLFKALLEGNYSTEHLGSHESDSMLSALLTFAAIKGNLETFNIIESKITGEVSSNTLYFAADGGNLDLVQKLTNQDFSLNVRFNRMTPLQRAVQKGHNDIVTYFLDSNKYYLQTAEGQNILEEAVESAAFYNKEDLLDQLLALIRGPLSEKVMSYGAQGGNVSILQKLLNKGANPNAKMQDDLTPLILAIISNHPDAVQFLVNNGADPFYSAPNGVTPLQLARGGRQIGKIDKKIVDILKQKVGTYSQLLEWIKHGTIMPTDPRSVTLVGLTYFSTRQIGPHAQLAGFVGANLYSLYKYY